MRTYARVACMLLVGLMPASARAQLGLEPTLDLASGFHFRGLTLTNRPVLQPALTLTGVPPAGALSITLWSNLEPAAYDGSDELSALDGSAGFTELDVIVESEHQLGRLGLSAALTHYRYAPAGDGASEPPTTELALGAAWDGTLSPSLTLIADVGTVQGLYAEAALAAAAHGVELRALLGWSTGQADDEDRASYYGRDGFTHAELSASVPLRAGPLAVRPALLTVFGFDPEARVIAPGRDRRIKFFAGASFGWSRGDQE